MKEYNIKLRGCCELEYTEGDHKMYLDIDFREPEICLNADYVEHWEKPFENEIIPESEKKRIINNVYIGMLKQGFSTNKVKLEE